MLQKVPANYQYADQAAYAIAWAYHDLGKLADANTAFNQFARAISAEPAGRRQPLPHRRLRVCAEITLRSLPATFAKILAAFPAFEHADDCLFLAGPRAGAGRATSHAAAARDTYRQYQQQYQTGPLLLDAALGAGRAALANKQYATALADLHSALALCPTLRPRGAAERANDVQPEALFTIGRCYFLQAHYADALKAYAGVAACNMEPWYSNSLLEMARCSALANDPAAAATTLRLLLKTFPNSTAAKAAPRLAKDYNLKLDEE